MARGVYSTSNYFLYTGGLVTAHPLSMACWVYPTDFLGVILMGLYYTGGALTKLDGWDIQIAVTTGYVLGECGDGTAVSNATGAAVIANQWNHVAATFVSATERYSYLNGAISPKSSANRSPSAAPGKTAIGIKYRQDNSVAGAATVDVIGEAGFWNVALTAADVLQLAAGYSPKFVKPESLVAYYPLIRGDASGDEPDLMGGLKMVEQGTVAVAAHTRVFFPYSPIKLWKPTAGGGAVNVTVAENKQAQVSDISPVVTITGIATAEANQAQVSDLVTLTVAYVIATNENNQTQTSDVATVTAISVITMTECNQSQSADVITITVISPVTVTEVNQTQVSDAAEVSFSTALWTIEVAETYQTQAIDLADLNFFAWVAQLGPIPKFKSKAYDVASNRYFERGIWLPNFMKHKKR